MIHNQIQSKSIRKIFLLCRGSLSGPTKRMWVGRKKVWPLQGASKDCPTDRNNKIEDQESCVNDQSPERSRRAEGEKVHNLELLPAGMIRGIGEWPKDQNRENVVR